jgi:hypothetical protein
VKTASREAEVERSGRATWWSVRAYAGSSTHGKEVRSYGLDEELSGLICRMNLRYLNIQLLAIFQMMYRIY